MMPHFESSVHRVEKLTGVRCLSTNTDCLPNKINEIENSLKNDNIDIAVLVETIPKNCNSPELKNLKFNISGYTCLPVPKGRGICIYVNEKFEIIERYHEYDDLFSPSIFCKVKTTNNDIFILGAFYRSPNSSDEENENLIKLIDIVSNKFQKAGHKLLFVGDFNSPDIDWSKETCTKPKDHFQSKLLNVVQQCYLNQFVNRPTHHRALQNPTLIDLIFSNDPDFVFNINYNPPFGKSHHSVICFDIDIESLAGGTRESRIPKFCMDKGDYVGMKEHLSMIDWDIILNDEETVDTWWNTIVSIINKAKEIFIPRKKPKPLVNKPPKNQPSYKRTFAAPDSLLKKLKLKRYAFKTYKKFPTVKNYNTYAKYRNQVIWETRKAKIHKETKLAKDVKDNPKAFFQYVNTKLKPKENISNLLKDDGTLTSTDLEKCDVLNNFFASVFTTEDKNEIPTFSCPNTNFLSTMSITDHDMERALNSLKVNKSPGPDGLHPRILSELSFELSRPLTLLFNKTMSCGVIPSDWKIAEVRPIFKKGSKTSPGNYRPVSLTSIICKVFEGFVRNVLYKHLVDNNLLSEEQYGFCKGRSCITQLLNTIQDWFLHLDQNCPVDAVYLDFRKAFDTVPHERLLNKLYGYGVRGDVLNWVRNFLSDRSQFVSIFDERSSTIPVTSGVPQGSVLGPTLFIYFINDLPQSSIISLKIFADDTKAYVPIINDTDRLNLQVTIDNLVDWSEKWLLRFNSSKCKVLHLGKNNPCYKYTIKEGNITNTLEVTKCEKDLGVHIDPLLSFDDHIIYIIKKSRGLSGLIMRIITFKTAIIMIPLFKSLIRPILEYGNAVWSPYKKYQIQNIETIQRHYTKRIIGMKNLDYTSRLRALKLPSLEYRRLRGDLIEMYKMTHNLYDPLTTNSLLTLNNSITRSNQFKLSKPRVNTKPFQKFFTNRIINTWNGLPGAVVSASSINSFKNYVDDHFKKIIYCIDIDF